MEINRHIPDYVKKRMHIERWSSPSDHFYQTREEIEEAYPGIIDWELWDRLVVQTKEEIARIPITVQEQQERPTKNVWAYSISNGKFLGRFKSATEASERLGINKSTISTSAASEKPYFGGGIQFMYRPLTIDEQAKLTEKKRRIAPTSGRDVEKWVYNEEGKFLGHFKNSSEVATHFNVPANAVNYYSWKQMIYKKRGLWFCNTPMTT